MDTGYPAIIPGPHFENEQMEGNGTPKKGGVKPKELSSEDGNNNQSNTSSES